VSEGIGRGVGLHLGVALENGDPIAVLPRISAVAIR
jgi:hypothetical protein